MLSATPNEGQYSGNTLNVDLGGGKLYICIYIRFKVFFANAVRASCLRALAQSQKLSMLLI